MFLKPLFNWLRLIWDFGLFMKQTVTLEFVTNIFTIYYLWFNSILMLHYPVQITYDLILQGGWLICELICVPSSNRPHLIWVAWTGIANICSFEMLLWTMWLYIFHDLLNLCRAFKQFKKGEVWFLLLRRSNIFLKSISILNHN